MRKTDLNTLIHFITRTGMYIGKVKQDSIISFITGYEIGAEGKCNLTESISELLSSQYGYKKMSTGWPGQIREYAIKNELDWTTSFRKIVLKYFYLSKDFNSDSEFKNTLKSIIELKINQLNLDWVTSDLKDWINQWTGFTDFNEKNFLNIWSKAELKILTEFDNEINRIRDNNSQVTDRLLKLRIEYGKITKTQHQV